LEVSWQLKAKGCIMKRSARRSLFILIVPFFILLVISCSPQIADPEVQGDSPSLLSLGEPMTAARAFLQTQGVTEDEIHLALLKYALGFNRVTSLVNSVVYADLDATDRIVLKQRVDAALVELNAFDTICKELGAVGTKLDLALAAYDGNVPDGEKALPAKEPNEWHARRLIEIMLDTDTPVRFNIHDISRQTGVGMKKLLYLMQQTTNQLNTQIDIVDEQECEKEIAYLETVRDTAGNINATLALATPLGAFGGAAKAAATTTGAHALGWIGAAKKTATVVENASAIITFTDGVVNLAVNEQDIPPAFKSVSTYNKYVGIALGGVTGFKGSTTGDKIVGIVGSGTDLTTTFFEVKNGEVQASETPNRAETPTDTNTSSLGGVLPGGGYKVPDVDIGQWAFPDFDWGDAIDWEKYYDGQLVDAALDEFMDGLDLRFQDLIDTWDPSSNNDKLKKVTVDADGLPEFFDHDNPDDVFPEHEDVGHDPDPASFTVQVFATKTSDTLPLTVTFTAVPSGAFLLGKSEFAWDFGDGSPPYTVQPGDPAYSATVVREYTALPAASSFTVSVEVSDPRGYCASTDTTISISKTLQQMIDSSTGSIFNVPAGTYNESITVRQGLKLVGSGKESTIIEGSVALDPDTALESLTVVGAIAGTPAITNSNDTEKWAGHVGMDIDITDVVVRTAPDVDYGILFIDRWHSYNTDKIPYVGTIQGSQVTGCRETGIEIFNFSGEIRENILEGSRNNIQVSESSELAKIIGNEIRGATGVGIHIGTVRGIVSGNLVEDNWLGLLVGTTHQHADVSGNTFRTNGPVGAIVMGEMDGGAVQNNEVTGNTRYGSYGYGLKGGGIQVGTMHSGASIRLNTITANKGVAVYIENLGTPMVTTGYDATDAAVFADNTIQNNVPSLVDSVTVPGGGVYIERVYDGAVLNNTISGNSADDGSGLTINNLYGTVSGNSFTENLSASKGGGALIGWIGEYGVFTLNVFTKNEVVSNTKFGFGGAVCLGTVEGVYSDNVMTENSVSTTGAGKQGKGGGVFVSTLGPTGSFTGNQITGNQAPLDGGGCYIGGGPEPTYTISGSNSFSGNSLTDPLDTSYKNLYTPWADDRLP